jgi:hypothetical protein
LVGRREKRSKREEEIIDRLKSARTRADVSRVPAGYALLEIVEGRSNISANRIEKGGLKSLEGTQRSQGSDVDWTVTAQYGADEKNAKIICPTYYEPLERTPGSHIVLARVATGSRGNVYSVMSKDNALRILGNYKRIARTSISAEFDSRIKEGFSRRKDLSLEELEQRIAKLAAENNEKREKRREIELRLATNNLDEMHKDPLDRAEVLRLLKISMLDQAVESDKFRKSLLESLAVESGMSIGIEKLDDSYSIRTDDGRVLCMYSDGQIYKLYETNKQRPLQIVPTSTTSRDINKAVEGRLFQEGTVISEDGKIVYGDVADRARDRKSVV